MVFFSNIINDKIVYNTTITNQQGHILIDILDKKLFLGKFRAFCLENAFPVLPLSRQPCSKFKQCWSLIGV